MILGGQVAMAGPFDFMNQGQKKEAAAPAVDLNAMSANGAALIKLLGSATIAFSEAAITMLNAVGNKELAEKLKASLAELKKKPNDQEAIKKFVETDAKKAAEELNKINLASGTKLSLATDELVNAFGKLYAAGLLDVKAIEQAGKLVQEAQNVLGAVQKDPMKYGFSAVGTVNSLISSGKFIVDNVPEQGKNIQSFVDRLIKYFQANKIPMPSPEKLKSITDNLAKG